MTIKEAIEKARKGGWRSECERIKYNQERTTWVTFYESEGVAWLQHKERIEEILLDPKFWQCLGKAMGWNQVRCTGCWKPYKINQDNQSEHYHCSGDGGPYFNNDYWIYQWHRMIDHLADGGSIEDFFSNL